MLYIIQLMLKKEIAGVIDPGIDIRMECNVCNRLVELKDYLSEYKVCIECFEKKNRKV